jgi:exoribonuclease II
MIAKALNAKAYLRHTQQLVAKASPEVVSMLPQHLDEIRRSELYRQWMRSDGGRFETFQECVEAQQPHGLGLGQYRQWITPFQVYHLCDGYSDLQKALRPFVLDRLPAIAQGKRTDKEHLSNRKKLQGGGTGEEYLLRRLKKHDAQNKTEFAAKWARGEYKSVRKAAIAAGIVTPKTGGRPLKKDEDPVEMVKRYWARATGLQRSQIRIWLRSNEAKVLSGQ